MSVFKWFTQGDVKSPICSNGYEICKMPNAIEWNSTFTPSSAMAQITFSLAQPYTENDCEILIYVTTSASPQTVPATFLNITMPTVESTETPYKLFIQGPSALQANYIYEISIKNTNQKVSVTTTVGEETVTTDYYMISAYISELGPKAVTV